MRYDIAHSAESLEAFVNKLGTQLVNRSSFRLDEENSRSEPLYPYTLTHIYVVGVTGVEM